MPDGTRVPAAIELRVAAGAPALGRPLLEPASEPVIERARGFKTSPSWGAAWKS